MWLDVLNGGVFALFRDAAHTVSANAALLTDQVVQNNSVDILWRAVCLIFPGSCAVHVLIGCARELTVLD